jgi:release factor glutamine methyltransferase
MNDNQSIESLLRAAQQLLQTSSDSPRLDVEILLAHTLKQSRTYLRTWPQQLITAEQAAHFHDLLSRRANGEPIAYLTGQRDFWDMTLAVSPDTLIPRPETERLVELALEKIPADASWHIADLGTGSGAIALAIARERPHCHLLATDLSVAALDIAHHNAQRLGVRNIRFSSGHWFAPLAGEQFQLIVSNPPYIHPDDPHLRQGDLRFEPPSALQSGADGLADIRIICDQARQHLQPPGWLLLEHGYDQGPAVQELLSTLGYTQVSVYEDLAHNERVSAGKWEKNNN